MLFDANFIKLLMGGNAQLNPQHCHHHTIQKLLPQLLMPPIECRFFITQARYSEWKVVCSCFCDRPNSLYCISAQTLLLQHWIDYILAYIQTYFECAPKPRLMYTMELGCEDYVNHTQLFTGLLCLYQHYEVYHNYAVAQRGYCLYMKLNITGSTKGIQCALWRIQDMTDMLPFRLFIDAFPYNYARPPKTYKYPIYE